MWTARYGRTPGLLAALVCLTLGRAPAQQPARTSSPLAVLDFSNLGGYAWAGNDRLLVYSRARYRRYDLRWIGLTADLKPDYQSPPKDLQRIAGWGQSVTFSASPDGRWILGSDRGGPRVLDVTTGEAMLWPAEGLNGFWLPDGSGWLEVVHPQAPGDPAKQEQVERDLNAKNMELRLYQPFGDEWPSRVARKSRFMLPFEAVPIAAIGKDELLVGSRSLPRRQDVRLSRVRMAGPSRHAEAALLRCPPGGELTEVALAPDGKAVAYLAVRPLNGRTLSENGFQIEIGRMNLDGSNAQVIHAQTLSEASISNIGRDALYFPIARPRNLSWRPDGKILSYAVNDQVVLISATP